MIVLKPTPEALCRIRPSWNSASSEIGDLASQHYAIWCSNGGATTSGNARLDGATSTATCIPHPCRTETPWRSSTSRHGWDNGKTETEKIPVYPRFPSRFTVHWFWAEFGVFGGFGTRLFAERRQFQEFGWRTDNFYPSRRGPHRKRSRKLIRNKENRQSIFFVKNPHFGRNLRQQKLVKKIGFHFPVFWTQIKWFRSSLSP